MSALFCIFPIALYGEIQGASHATFDGWERHSLYVPARDGTQLALDYFRPTRAGSLHSEPLPVVWRFTPYGRYKLDEKGEGRDSHALPQHGGGLNGPDALEILLRAGYVVAVADWRGYGASFGVSNTWLGPQQAADARDITDWLAARPWSTGDVGMMGLSALASVQYLAASDASENLKAIFPAMGQFDHYDTFYLNGIYRPDLAAAWDGVIRPALDYNDIEPKAGGVAEVGSDIQRKKIAAAGEQHRKNQRLEEQVAAMPWRDSIDTATGEALHIVNSLWPKLQAVRDSGVAIYHWTGWFDAYGKSQLLTFANLDNPQKIHIGPYFHADRFGVDIFGEALRWFDYWLKGVDNGIMDEPRVRYFVLGDNADAEWRTADSWPLGDEQRILFYLSQGPSGSIDSINDGVLARHHVDVVGSDFYAVIPGISLGGYLERNNGLFRAHCRDKTVVEESCYRGSGYPDLADRYDAKSLTYTSAPLEDDVIIVGHPLVSLSISSSSPDAAIFVVLEEVEPDGSSHFLTDNALRLSHRTINRPVFNNLGLPWLGNLGADRPESTSGPIEIKLDLKPIANRFDAGNRIRLTIAGTDANIDDPVVHEPGRVFELFRGGQHQSWLEIPVLTE